MNADGKALAVLIFYLNIHQHNKTNILLKPVPRVRSANIISICCTSCRTGYSWVLAEYASSAHDFLLSLHLLKLNLLTPK